MSQREEQKTPTNKTNKVLLILVILLSMAVIGLLVERQQNLTEHEDTLAELDKTYSQKDSITSELQNLYQEYESMKTDNDSLNSQLSTEQAKIAEMIAELKQVKMSSDAEISKYKKQVASMRTIMKGYINQIDSLNTLNQELTEEVHQIRTDFSRTKKNNQKLEAENKVLAVKAEYVEAFEVYAVGLNNRGRATRKLGKVKKIQVSFKVSENPIAAKGNKDFYIRISRPDDYVLAKSDDDLFEFGGEKIVYSAKRSVMYEGEQMSVEMFYDGLETLLPGTYDVDVYTNGKNIGSGSFDLK